MRSAAQREQSRVRQERKRRRDIETRRLLAIAEAERMERDAVRKEIADETLAPAIMRLPIFTADGRMLLGSRVQIVEGRPVRAFSRDWQDNPIDRVALPKRERRAAAALRADWSDVGSGLGVGAVDWLRSGGKSEGERPPGHDAMMDQIEARANLIGAMTHAGAFAPSIARVVLDCIPLGTWAVETGKSFTDAKGWIIAGLGRVASFYWPARPVVRGYIEILTMGPPREDYDTSLEALDIA